MILWLMMILCKILNPKKKTDRSKDSLRMKCLPAELHKLINKRPINLLVRQVNLKKQNSLNGLVIFQKLVKVSSRCNEKFRLLKKTSNRILRCLFQNYRIKKRAALQLLGISKCQFLIISKVQAK